MTKLELLLIGAIAACTSREPPPSAGERAGSQLSAPVAARPGSAAGSATASSQPSGTVTGSAEPPGHNMTGLRPHQAANCPSALPGATTRLAMTPRGVDVSITSDKPAVVHRIVALTQLHVRGRTAEVARPHDGKHGGPGVSGYCPVLVSDQTKVTVTSLVDGVTVHVEARTPARVTELQETIRARAVQLPGYLSS